MNRIDFSVEEYEPDWGQWRGVVPIVDGVSLEILIRDFEAAHGFDVPGGYSGIRPADQDKVPQWVRYLWGEIHPEYGEPSNGITWLLGCDCSVAGCWPLEARVTVNRDRVIWDQFRQPHRPQQDYSAFGPFIFERDAYEVAVKDLASALAAQSALKGGPPTT